MRGCIFILNDRQVHTGLDLDLVQEVKEISKPTPRTYSIEVPGRNGDLDLTDALTGEVCYANRSIKLSYFGTGTRDELLELDKTFNEYHGQYVEIIDDDTPTYYYKGRASVTTTIGSCYINIEIEVDAYPFLKKINDTIYTKYVAKNETVICNNRGMSTVFTVTTDAPFTLSNGTTTITLSEAGTYEISGFRMKKGANALTFNGKGTVIIKFTEEII